MTIDEQLEVLKQRPIEAWPYPRILVGVLQERAMSYASQVFYDFWAIANQGVPIVTMPYGRTDVNRNKLAVELLRSNFTHLLMLDIDHKHPKTIIQRLARWLLVKPEVQVVGGLNFRRTEPFDPSCGFWGDDGKYYPPAEWGQGLLKVDLIGTGSILIAREVFELIPPPWFYYDYSEVWADVWPGEDIAFSKLCNKYDINLYVDTTTTSPHMTEAMVNDTTFRKHLGEDETTDYDEFMEKIAKQAQE